MSKKKDKSGVPNEVAAVLEEARLQALAADADDPRNPFSDGTTVDDEDGEPGAAPAPVADLEAVQRCAALDHSDTDNGERLRAHFGEDLLVLAQSKARKAAYAVWTGTHWDIDTGDARSITIAQQVGSRIALEAAVLKMTEAEKRDWDRAKEARDKPEADWTPIEKIMMAKAEKAADAYRKRVARRMTHAVSSKNKGRIEAMLAMAASHIMRGPDEFNADPLKVALAGHTLTFKRVRKNVRNPEFDDPDVSREDVPEFVMINDAAVDVIKGHRREDLITQRVPVDYDPKAACPLWLAFVTRFLPVPEVRRMVQVAFGLGLIGLTVQKLFFHYGVGANGKSVAMETICRLLGEVSVTLPSESFVGEGKGGGAANPDMARLYGRRMLRVKEMPEGEDLRENLVKDLTGGEHFTVRDLFQGYFDFKPLFTGHMSGNGYPKITGTDNGIWRRMAVVHWPIKLEEHEQREFEDVVSEFAPEFPGILNWLIEGVLIFLREGLVVPDDVRQQTQQYRDEMDPTSAFCARCVVPDTNGQVTAKDFYQSYVDFIVDQGGKPISMTRFGLIMKKKFRREDGRVNIYHGLRLEAVPRPPATRDDDYEGHLR